MTSTNSDGTARTLVADGKDILAADETPSTLTKRITALGIESTPESRREMLFTTPAWRGKDEKLAAGQLAFYHRAKCNSAAALGRCTTTMEQESVVA